MANGQWSYFNWLNLLWFQAAWFCALYFQDNALWVLLLSLAADFYLLKQRQQDLSRLIWVTVIGGGADALLSLTGVFVFPDQQLIPYWLLLLWAHFALSLNYSMFWLASKPYWLKSLCAGIFAPLSYLAGVKFSAVTLPLGELLSLFIIAVIWAALMPVYLIATRFMGETTNEHFKEPT